MIFTTVFSLFFVLAASVITTSLRITKANQKKVIATHYAEELREWLQAEKEINWGGTTYAGGLITNFTEQVTQSTPASTEFCFNTAPLSPSWPSKGVGSCYFELEGQYRRMATFSATLMEGNFVKQISVRFSVEWKDGNYLYSVPLKAVYSVWE